MKDSDFLMERAASALLMPSFFRNNFSTALASSLSAERRLEDIAEKSVTSSSS